jgi:hypothetical protein
VPARLDYVGLAAHVQKALMLPGETGGRQILGSRRAAHRDCDFGTASLFELAVGGPRSLREVPHSRWRRKLGDGRRRAL